MKPLSVNAAFQGRRYKTSECKDYEKELWYSMPVPKMIKGKVSMTIEFSLKNHKKTDVDNLVKPLLDIIVKRGFIEDDRMIYEMCLYKYPAVKDKIAITIAPYV